MGAWEGEEEGRDATNELRVEPDALVWRVELEPVRSKSNEVLRLLCKATKRESSLALQCCCNARLVAVRKN